MRRARLLSIRTLSVVLLLAGSSATALHAEEPSPKPELKGYCPASYLLSGKAVKGDPAFKSTHDGKLYYLANGEAKKAFDAKPQKYLPQFNGMCTVALGGMYGNRLYSDPEVFEIRDGKVYLFCIDRARQLFVKEPEKYISKAAERFKSQPADAPVRELSRPKRDAEMQNPLRPAREMIGQVLPPAKFTRPDGTTLATQDLQDRATLVMFYTSWCSACKKALPTLNDMAAKYKDKPVRFLAVSQDMLVDEPVPTHQKARTKEQVVDYWKAQGATFPMVFDPARSGRFEYKVRSYPTFFLLGKSGKVENVYLGGSASRIGKIQTDIDALLAGGELSQKRAAPSEDRKTLTGAVSPEP